MSTATNAPDLVRDLYERWSAAFAAEPEMPLEKWRALIEEWPQVTAEPEIGSAPAAATNGQRPCVSRLTPTTLSDVTARAARNARTAT